MRYNYEINSDLEIRVWDTENPNEKNAPFIYQPHWPNGAQWTDKAEANSWVNLLIESLVNPDSEYLPGNSPDEPKKLRLQPEPTDTNA